MNKQSTADLIAVLGRSTDKSLILKCLLKIRNDLFQSGSGSGSANSSHTDPLQRQRSNIELFYRLNGIPPLVRLISKPYETIIDVALSILANCCVHKQCCRQAIAQGVVPPLLSILKSIPSTSVQCRACRLLGNLARESNEKICGLAKGLGVAIAAVLTDNRDADTLNMAVRAARLLWNEMPFYDEFVRHGGVQKILLILVAQTTAANDHAATAGAAAGDDGAGDAAEPMADDAVPNVNMNVHVRNIQFMESVNSKVFDREILKKEPPRRDAELFGYPPPEARDRRQLIGELMRSLQALTARLSFRVVNDVFAVEHSCQCIVYFARPDSPQRACALRILSNLARSVPASAEHLSRADAITAACRLITSLPNVLECDSEAKSARATTSTTTTTTTTTGEPPLSESEERHCISVICYLAGDACNRAKIRISGAFTRIMEIAKRTKCDAVLTSILMGLQNFRYDNNSIDQMIGVGLVSVLVERLERLMGGMSEAHTKRPLKRTAVDETPAAAAAAAATSCAAAADCAADMSDADEMDGVGGENDEDRQRAVAQPSHKRRHIDAERSLACSPSVQVPCGYSMPGSPCGSAAGMSPSRMNRSPTRSDAVGDLNATDDMDSEYSPVCSDIEEGDVDDGRLTKKRASDPDGLAGGDGVPMFDVMQLLGMDGGGGAAVEEPVESDEEDSDAVKIDAGSPDAAAKMKTIHLIIDTLCNVSFRLKYATDLCTAPILSTLVRACRLASRRRSATTRWDALGAPQVLSHIVEETINFVPIIKQNIIFKIHAMTQCPVDHEDCGHCNDLKIVGRGLLGQLTAVGETGYGRGEMARMLLRGDERTQTQIAIVTTYIIRQPKYLHTLLVEHGGLYTVIGCILNKKPIGEDGADLATDAANGLTALAAVLEVCAPASDELLIDSESSVSLVEDEALPATTENDYFFGDYIWFVAGDAADYDPAQRTCFDRRTLVAYSDVFASMLQNDFREANENQVRLRRQTIGGIRYFLDAVRRLSAGRAVRLPTGGGGEEHHIDAVLQAYDMAQVYMLPELEEAVHNVLLHLLAPATAQRVFDFAMREHKQQLADVAIAYYLSCAVGGERKVRMFREADDGDYAQEWYQMMLDMVVYTCQSRMAGK